jgi:hypothetical protein
MMMAQAQCSNCKDYKPLSEKYFYKKYKKKDKSMYWDTSSCRDCHKKKCAERKRNNPERVREENRLYQEKVKANPILLDKQRERSRFYWWKNRKSKLKKAKIWRDNNKALRNFYHAFRKALKRRQIIAKLFKEEMKQIFLKADKLSQKTGIKRHVDHIIPINHSLVCGLDVPWNMQILTKEENLHKLNKFDGTYENKGWKNSFKRTKAFKARSYQGTEEKIKKEQTTIRSTFRTT